MCLNFNNVRYILRWVPTCMQAFVHLIYIIYNIISGAFACDRLDFLHSGLVWHWGQVCPFCPREQWPSHLASLTPTPRILNKAGLPPVGDEAWASSPLPPFEKLPVFRCSHYPQALQSLDIKELTLAFKQGQAQSSCQSHSPEHRGFQRIRESSQKQAGGVKRIRAEK